MDDDDGRNIDFELMLFFLFQENCINRYRLLDGLGAALCGCTGMGGREECYSSTNYVYITVTKHAQKFLKTRNFGRPLI